MWGYGSIFEESRQSCMLEKSGVVSIWLNKHKCITYLIVKIVKKLFIEASHQLIFLSVKSPYPGIFRWEKSASGFKHYLEKLLILFNFRDTRCSSCSLKTLWEFKNTLRTSVITMCAQIYLTLQPVNRGFIFCAVNLSGAYSDNILHIGIFFLAFLNLKIKNQQRRKTHTQSRP